MHPKELIEFIIVGAIIISIAFIANLLKDRWRKTGWLLAFVVFSAYGIFFGARPFWIDAQIDHKMQLLRPYLEEQYPDKDWTISAVPHRKSGYRHLNPYYIGVVFENEPGVTYYYWVESKDTIYQMGRANKEEKTE
ncbi:hypothetical protein CEF21_07530 [Bacillus sp. FJAT-42376]|uniref:hypothetical protein n=1 Tax=Bacillus sp. FJAT-42376 TaxID=2014076 RepID=UPI000F4F16A0|nr:hypothetical protein [Bacillus sp. FJAT-42376]AZB42153.1 hypothetical protein CEF21_07530 [Bacillus sp. FJAT-42376]